jgi:manganese/zinc/iron transport system permease protein
MLLGAAGAAVVAVVLIEAVKRLGRSNRARRWAWCSPRSSPAVCCCWSSRHVFGASRRRTRADGQSRIADLAVDADGLGLAARSGALAGLPPELGRMALACAMMVVLTVLFWRWLKIATFDEGFAEALGMPAAAVGLRAGHRLGACGGGGVRRGGLDHRDRDVHLPARRRAADDLEPRGGRSCGRLSSPHSRRSGLRAGGYGPLWLGATDSVSAAGMIATVSGVILGLACVFGPHRHRVGAAQDRPSARRSQRNMRSVGQGMPTVPPSCFRLNSVNSVSTSCGLCLIAA